MLKDDGDLIKACGFLAIYSGNLENELDDLYGIAKSFCPELTDYEHLRFTDKARHLRKALTRAYKIAPDYAQKADEEPRVSAILRHCKVVADARNEVIHSSIYAETDGRTLLKNNRQGTTRHIASAEVYDLANEIWGVHGAVYGLRFAVTRLKLAMERSGRSVDGESH
jgi:hypothetical protein